MKLCEGEPCKRDASFLCVVAHEMFVCAAKTNVLALFEKNKSIDFSDWPLHTHRSLLFEPVQSQGFFYS